MKKQEELLDGLKDEEKMGRELKRVNDLLKAKTAEVRFFKITIDFLKNNFHKKKQDRLDAKLHQQEILYSEVYLKLQEQNWKFRKHRKTEDILKEV